MLQEGGPVLILRAKAFQEEGTGWAESRKHQARGYC